MKLRISSSILLTVATLLTSCNKDKVTITPVDPNCPDTISFAQEILPLIEVNCKTCHDTGNGTGYTLNDYNSISTNAAVALSSMRGESGFQSMPPSGSLPDSLIQLFSCWIGQGKLDN